MMLPPECARLVTSPTRNGSTAIQTIGVVSATERTASATGSVMATIRTGLSLDDQVLSLDIAQPTQLSEKRLVKTAT